MSIRFESFPVGPLQCNCTIAADTAAGEAIVIDPGDNLPEIERRLAVLSAERPLRVAQIVITHAHFDHIGAAIALKRKTGAPILLNQNDLDLLKMQTQFAAFFGLEGPELFTPDASPSDAETVGLSTLPAETIHTPGHTQGSLCLHFPTQNILIAGDTLFAGSVGRTDLPGGNTTQLLDSIRTKLMALPEETRVIAGHGPETTIGEEKSSNPFL